MVGGGSIGSRHLKNLRSLGLERLAVVEPDQERLSGLRSSGDVIGFEKLEAGIDWRPDFIVIATPSHLHLEPALMAAQQGIDIFCEKPLSHTSDGLEELSEMVAKKNLVTLVACNMRFHPGPLAIKEMLLEDRVGKVLFARHQVGSYLPDWRSGVDYRKNYAAKAETGGGCILDCIHEIDLARWYFGDVVRVFCFAGHRSSLEIETEDVASLILQHTSGATSEIHLDYVQRTYQRDCQIVGEKGSIFWDFNCTAVRWYDADSAKWTEFSQSANWSVNDMYIAEMQHFLSCLASRQNTTLPIPDAVELMRTVFAAKLSAHSGAFVSIEEVPVCS